MVAIFQLSGSRPWFHVLLMKFRMIFFPGRPKWVSISLWILSGPGDLRAFNFLRALFNSVKVSSSSKVLMLAPGADSLAFRSSMTSLSLGLSLSALEMEAKNLLCSFALFWSSTSSCPSLFSGLGFEVL